MARQVVSVGVDHRFGQSAPACSRWIAKSSGCGLDLAIQAERGGPNDDHTLSVYCGESAIARLIRYCQSQQVSRFLLVADENTYAALGQRVEAGLKEHEWDVRTVILHGAKVVADEGRIFEVLYHAHGEERTYLAAGSGTVTDITVTPVSAAGRRPAGTPSSRCPQRHRWMDTPQEERP